LLPLLLLPILPRPPSRPLCLLCPHSRRRLTFRPTPWRRHSTVVVPRPAPCLHASSQCM